MRIKKDLKIKIKKDLDITKEQEETARTFIKKIASSPNKHIIYRGNCNLKEQYNTDTSNLDLLSSHIFMIGEKGKNFWTKKPKFKFTEHHSEIIEYIWKRITTKICNIETFKNKNTQNQLQKFKNKNPDFFHFFSKKENKSIFKSRIEEANPKTKEKIIDYYFSFFHTIGKSVYQHSYFLSSSTSQKIAEDFKNSKEGIILIGWVPKKNENKRLIKYNIINKTDQTLKNLGLPVYEKPIYPEQKEICLKCGILPHYIIGFKYRDLLIVNPSILNEENKERNIIDIIQKGLIIDQTNFKDFISKTNHKSAYLVYNDGTYENHSI